MTRDETSREIAGLASGTLARLFGVTEYTAIDNKHYAWMMWIGNQPHTRTWETWQECWEEYRQHAST